MLFLGEPQCSLTAYAFSPEQVEILQNSQTAVFAARFSPTQCLFSIQCLLPLSLELSLPHLPYLTSFPCSAPGAAAVAPPHQGKRRGAETKQSTLTVHTGYPEIPLITKAWI